MRMKVTSTAFARRVLALMVGAALFWQAGAARQQPKDPWYSAQPGSKEERTVVKNAAYLFQWYEAFVGVPPQIHQLPAALPEARPDELFTPEEVERLLPRLPPESRREVAESVRQTLALAREQTEGLRGTPYERPERRIFFTGPIALDNPNDVIEAVARLEQAAYVREGVAALVNYKIYRQSRERLSTVPVSMERFVQGEYERLKSALDPADRAKLKGMNMRIGSALGEERLFWLGVCAPRSCKLIRLSPLLARAMFMQIVRSDGQVLVASYDRFERSGGRLETFRRGLSVDSLRSDYAGQQLLTVLREIPREFNNPVEKFKESLHFPLAHEMAHVYLGDGRVNEPSEERCDEAALLLLRRLNGRASLGAFESILNQAIKEGSTDLWGLDNNADSLDDLLNRFEQLRLKMATPDTSSGSH